MLPALLSRLIAVTTVAAVGTVALAQIGPAQRATLMAGQVAAPGVHRLSVEGTPTTGTRPARPTAAADRVVAEPVKAVKKPTHHVPAKHHHHAARWLPSGTGMWIYEWGRSSGGDASRIVARAKSVGLSTLYLRTGSSWDGLSGANHLGPLLHATHGSSIRVVAWDFPRLRRPVHDALRLAHAAHIGRTGNGAHVAAVAPDIETPSEGTFNAAWRVRLYLTALRRHLPKGVTILSTVPWPSRYRIADYPYAAVAGHSDALIPMAYWYNNSPSLVTGRSISYLWQRFHKPVMPVGQGYDGKLDVPSLHHNNLSREVPSFFRTARAHGARAVSLWSWQAAPPTTWRALSSARRLFHAR